MIKGLIALLTSGILLNPMVILGIICGIYLMNAFSVSEVIAIFKNYGFYLKILAVAFLFSFLFERVYYTNGRRINWKATLSTAFGRFITLLITTFFTSLFIFSMTFSDEKPQPDYQFENQIKNQPPVKANPNISK